MRPVLPSALAARDKSMHVIVSSHNGNQSKLNCDRRSFKRHASPYALVSLFTSASEPGPESSEDRLPSSGVVL